MRITNGGVASGIQSIVLFPFDDHSIPFQHGLKLHLQGGRIDNDKEPVVPLGEPGAHDSVWIAFYGTVIDVAGELWMWYLGQGPGEEWHQRVCLAKSNDGRHWVKPNLGLVEFNGNKNNNLVDMGDEMHVQACVIFHEPEDPNPNKRFKMAFESRKHESNFSVAYSADGIRWQESVNNPVGKWFEMGGGTKLDDAYYVTGQGGNHGRGIRQLVTLTSYDFECWSEATCSGLRRGEYSNLPPASGKNSGEQVHLGAALWNRENVIVGVYGKWDGHPSNDRRMLTMDLGLAVSNDALHYKEPIPNFALVEAAEFNWSTKHNNSLSLRFPALMQGQGFENIGDETLFWFAPWPEEASDGVRLASWQRDRLGYFSANGTGYWSYLKGQNPHFVSAPINLEGKAAKLAINIAGVNPHSSISVEVQDHKFRPLEGFEGSACRAPKESGFRQPITWKNQETINELNSNIRIRLDFHGVRPEDIRIYAVYLDHVTV